MKAILTIAIVISLGASTTGLAQGWCDYEDDYHYYEEPHCEMVPLHELIADLVRYYVERPAPPQRWEEPGWIAPKAMRPELRERQETKSPPAPRRVMADYKPPVPPPMVQKPEPEPEPKQESEFEIEVAPDPQPLPAPEIGGETQIAVPVPGAPGFVFSPFDGEKRKVDVRGLPAGSLARDPYTKEVFRVP